MPVPAYRMPNLLQPRSPERVTQFPGNFADVADPFAIQQWLNQTGRIEPPRRMTPYGPAGGLLDVRPGVTAPVWSTPGLLQPAIWDRVRRGLLGTEGMRGPYGGGQRELPLSGGSARGRAEPKEYKPPKIDWAYSEQSGIFATTTPSGVRVHLHPTHERGVEISFYDPKAVRGNLARSRSMYQPSGKGSTRQAIERYSDVFAALKDYVTKFKPRDVEFGAETKGHALLYKRLGPDIAKELGGRLEKIGAKKWRIFFD
jgi:hypothetical protein